MQYHNENSIWSFWRSARCLMPRCRWASDIWARNSGENVRVLALSDLLARSSGEITAARMPAIIFARISGGIILFLLASPILHLVSSDAFLPIWAALILALVSSERGLLRFGSPIFRLCSSVNFRPVVACRAAASICGEIFLPTAAAFWRALNSGFAMASSRFACASGDILRPFWRALFAARASGVERNARILALASFVCGRLRLLPAIGHELYPRPWAAL